MVERKAARACKLQPDARAQLRIDCMDATRASGIFAENGSTTGATSDRGLGVCDLARRLFNDNAHDNASWRYAVSK